MKLFYCDQFVLPLPAGHRFPMEKYAMLRAQLANSGCFRTVDFCEPPAATLEQLMLAHAPDYVEAVERGTLSAAQIRQIGFPWSPQMVERSKRSSGATLAAAKEALFSGISANLAGGTHHAHYDFGAGFCVFNDAVIAARTMQQSGAVKRVAIVDCDVHQGDGTAAICSGDSSIYTFSIHGAKNFPARKQQSDLDIDCEDGMADEAYLAALAGGLSATFAAIAPELVIYLAGADPYEDDRLGRLKISKAGLATRDRLVFAACTQANAALAIVMAGGYANNIEDTVDIHAATILQAAHWQRSGRQLS
jgi:acetoin utilization deacetylase AcuC-like enzyme